MSAPMKMRTDEMIKSDVIDHLTWDNRLDASNITVTVNNGMVILDGHVISYSSKLVAASTALSIPGVMEVENNLEVEFPTTLPALDDDDLKTHITNLLIWNPYLRAYKIDVEVVNGWVTLKGIVQTYWEKTQAEVKVSQVTGVTGITNKLAVVPDGDRVDEAIAEDVVKAIDRRRAVSIDDVSVKVDDGDVILTGSVPNRHAKEAAYQAALYTFGVVNVDDDLVVTLL